MSSEQWALVFHYVFFYISFRLKWCWFIFFCFIFIVENVIVIVHVWSPGEHFLDWLSCKVKLGVLFLKKIYKKKKKNLEHGTSTVLENLLRFSRKKVLLTELLERGMFHKALCIWKFCFCKEVIKLTVDSLRWKIHFGTGRVHWKGIYDSSFLLDILWSASRPPWCTTSHILSLSDSWKIHPCQSLNDH